MNLGAESSKGEILLFLHADTVLPISYRTAMEQLLSLPRIAVGAFRLKIDSPATTYRIIEKAVNLRSLKLGLPYGDQALFIRRETFNSIGGYPNLPIMEDFEFIRRLRKIGEVGISNENVLTSARRWERLGPWRTTLLNQLLIIAYRVGVAPEKLARIYYR
jgi:rSAM/selenodomain-associated transferase 2